MKVNTNFKTIEEMITAEIVEKKSKFIATLIYADSVKEAEAKIDEIRKKFHDAKHHCFAYRIMGENSILEKASDDGEPSGTAGATKLQLLSKNELINVVVVVTRYFGGILLGTGGLVRAYTEVTNQAINKAEIVKKYYGQLLKIPISYQNLSYFQYYCNKNHIAIIKINYTGVPFCMIEVTFEEKDKILHEMEERQFDIQEMEVIQERYFIKHRYEKD